MELYLVNLKSFILFVHLAGLAIGIGGTWILEVFIMKHLKKATINKDNFAVIHFISQFVLVGLAILWISGLAFLVYYALYTPESLSNEKIWAKVFIVVILTINGFFIHKFLLPLVEQCTSDSLTKILSTKKLKYVLFMGAVSFISWVFPIILGVSKSLNFSVSAMTIISVYLLSIGTSLLLATLLAKPILKNLHHYQQSRTFRILPIR